MWEWLLESLPPALCCVQASPGGFGSSVGTEGYLDSGKGSLWRMGSFWLLAQLEEKMAGEMLG